MKALLILLISAIITWTLALWKTTRVTSATELSSLGFGWPLQWIEQDQSRFQWASYPQDARLTFVKFDQLPAYVDWGLFAANVLIIACALLVIYFSFPLILRMFRK
ncbi:hypothetical protein [Ketogulonicigenium vulgare]|uniref:hypothetical protein n=1 Tax=Ketogulonicigenium vulgare TaxID=92945 RepID=UPI002359F9B5|nr:hypothetical protein [Ketogulonicigenium vulgare]